MALLLLPAVAFAQDSGRTIPSGKFTPGHTFRALTPNGTVFGDAGGALGSTKPGTGYLSEIGITNTGAPLCINDALINDPGGYHQFCLGANSLGGGLISYNAYGGASPLPLNCYVNGSLSPCFTTLPVFDPRQYGAACGTQADATTAIQAALDAAAVDGGEVDIPCPFLVAGTLTMNGAVRLHGIGPVNYPGQQDVPGPSVYPTSGPALDCTSISGPCITVAGIGSEIDHINFWNPQPAVPTTCPGAGPCNNWNPTVYPFIIATQANSGWQGLNIHNVTCTSCSNFVDLEGTPDYHVYSGTQIILRDLWCNACLNNGLTIHLIDNPLLVSHFEFTPQWNFNRPPLGYYLRQNLVGFEVKYAAAPLFDNIGFFTTKSAIQLDNGTVTNNFGTVTFASSAMMMTNVQFNEVCQAMTQPGGNGTTSEVNISNVYVWGDESGFGCSKGKAIFDIPSNHSRLSLDNLSAAFIDTLINAGCGSGCNPGGGAIVSLTVNAVQEYSHFSAAQNFVNAPSGTVVNFGASNFSLIFPAVGAGNLMGPGPDATQAFMQPLFVGGGTNPLEGAAALQGSAGTAGSGFAAFYLPDHSQAGWTGGCTGTGPTPGCSFASAAGSIYIKPKYTTGGATLMSFGTSGGHSLVNLGALPTSCSGLPTGTLWDNANVIQACP